ncbi:MAG TPA: hypothetical protein VFP31_06835 [Gaiellaceae bacterium]|jgi:hypothetical protein|nr:hypothetical protein [Gaiellaceae bacterium]
MIGSVLALVVIVLGLAIIVRTVAEGVGGGAGLVLGTLFVVAGAGRLWLARRL